MNIIKIKSLLIATVFAFLSFPNMNFAQAPPMGSAAGFVLFSSKGAVGNTGISHVTGNVGAYIGPITAFGNVNGVMRERDSAGSKCASDLRIAYNALDSTTATFFPSALLGNGDTLVKGIYSIPTAATLNSILFLDAKGNPNAVFIIKIKGSFSTSAASQIILLNGALACNVFWKVEGLVSMAAGTKMKGTVIANNAAISMGSGVSLEGRALSTAGAVTINNTLAYLPIGCGSPKLTGPVAPILNSVGCYALFSADGPVTNTGITSVKGDVGTNVGLTKGFDTLKVAGKVHAIPDGSTAQCAADLAIVYQYLDSLTYDIELLFPVQLGNNLVLTPHTYKMGAAAVLTDTLILNAQGDTSAIFVFQIKGAFTTGTYANIKLINGARSKNIYWKVEGAVAINNYTIFRGTLICNNGAIGAINTGVLLDGRALSTKGALNTAAITAIIPSACGGSSITSPNIITEPLNQIACNGLPVTFVVVASGTGLQYQWRRGNTNLNNGGNISGAKTDKLTINPVNSSDTSLDYNVIVSGTSMPNDTSLNATLKICKVSNVIKANSNNLQVVNIYPNPFGTSLNIRLNISSENSKNEWVIYNAFGEEVMHMEIIQQLSTLQTGQLSSGIYFYKLISNGRILQSGKLISE